MSAALVLAAALAVLALVPGWLAQRLQHRADPRTVAALSLITLVGFIVLPLGWLVCLAGIFGQLAGGHRGLCRLDTGVVGAAQLVTYGAAVVLGLGTAVVAARQGRYALRLAHPGPAQLGASRRMAEADTTVWVVSSDEPVAFTGGLVRVDSVVSTGLLDLLEETEQIAVIEHEATHQRAGHPRALLVGATAVALYGWLPPVRRAWGGLRRALEAVADDQAARMVGPEDLISALAKVTIAKSPLPCVGFADPADLRYRIERLTKSRPPNSACSAGVALVASALSLLLGWALCSAVHTPSTLAEASVCTVGLGWVGIAASRPWSRRRWSPSPRHFPS